MSMTFPAQLIAAYEKTLAGNARLRDSGLLAPLTIDPLRYALFESKDVQVDILRSDQLHPIISGNKWFKLKYNLAQAQQAGCTELLSFGGAWSNHLHALACLGHLLGIKTVGKVRGDELDPTANSMLAEARLFGMELEFVDRRRYRDYRSDTTALSASQRWIIPEGGDNELGMLGAGSMMMQSDLLQRNYSHVVVALGTGCTFAGLRMTLPDSVKLVGVAALKGAWVRQEMQRRMHAYPKQAWYLDCDHHFGGFGRVDPALLSFIAEIGDNTGLVLDPVYTGKAMIALRDLIADSVIPCGSRVLFVHSGGLQGRRGYPSNPLSKPHISSE